MKILISVPLLKLQGGVSNHFNGLRKYFSKDVIFFEFIPSHYISERVKNKVLVLIIRTLIFIYELFKFQILLISNKEILVLLNPSFKRNSLKRELIFLRIAKIYFCKVAFFFHGWDNDYYLESLNNSILKEKLKEINGVFVLSREYLDKIQTLGVNKKLFLTTTKVDNRLLEYKNIRIKDEINTILFLARIEEEKGVLITIKAFEILKTKYKYLRLRIVGKGNFFISCKDYVSKQKIHDVFFTGSLSGQPLIEEFINSDIYILPSFSEGMPASLLEAMAFGLPIITRPVGGIVDFFIDGEMGFLIDSFDPMDFSKKIEFLIENKLHVKNISLNNSEYAKQNFLSDKVANSFENNLMEIYHDNNLSNS